MPDAVAGFGSDFAARPAGRRGTARPAKRRKGNKPRPGAAFFAKVPRYGAIASSALIGVGIIVNALMMQHGHRTAVLFGGPPAKPAAVDAAQPVAAMPQPVARPTAPQVAAAPRSDAPPPTAAHDTPSKAQHSDDAIARLIGGNTPATAPRRSKATADKTAAAKTLAVKVTTARNAPAVHRKADD